MQLKTDALVIREQNIGEADRLVTLLSGEYGLMRAFAREARRVKSRSVNATQLFSYSHFTIFKGRDRYIIDEAAAQEVFFALRSDIEKLALAQYFAELTAHLAPEQEEAGAFLRLILNALHLLAAGKKELPLLKAAFELRMMSLAGYSPDLTACSDCGRFDAEAVFALDLQEGVLRCADCQAPGEGKVPLSASVLAALRHILYQEPGKLFAFTLPPEGLQALGAITEQYLLAHLQLSLPTLRFYNTIPR